MNFYCGSDQLYPIGFQYIQKKDFMLRYGGGMVVGTPPFRTCDNIGQLGNNNTTYTGTVPIPTCSRGMDWKFVCRSFYNTAAITCNGRLFTWGSNQCGQLGNSLAGTADKSTPVQVVGCDWRYVYPDGILNMYGIKNDGSVWCWGSNGVGGSLSTPVATTYGTGWKCIISNCDACYLMSESYEWYSLGRNCFGLLAAGVPYDNPPAGCISRSVLNSSALIVEDCSYVDRYTRFRELSTHRNSTSVLAIGLDCHLYFWGRNQCGWNIPLQSDQGVYCCEYNIPVQIPEMGNCWRKISLGFISGAGITRNGELYTWGCNCYGHLGDGTTVSSYCTSVTSGSCDWVDVHVGGFGSLITPGVGSFFMVATKKDGSLWAWGRNDCGQLGIGSTVPCVSTPVQVTNGGFKGWKNIGGHIGWSAIGIL